MGCLCVWSIVKAQSIKFIENVYKTQVVDKTEQGKNESQTNDRRPVGQSSLSNTHPILASHQISAEALRLRLQEWNSPLADYAQQIVDSKYSSTIIGICYIEQYRCSKAPNNNYWGLGPGIKYVTPEDGIEAIDNWLAKHEDKHPTIESMRGFYCQSACLNWESTVLKIKADIENAENQ